MKFDVSEITSANGASLDLNFEEAISDFSWPGDEIEFQTPVSFTGRLTNVNGLLRLEGRLKTRYTVKCYRCLKDVSNDMTVHVRENFQRAGAVIREDELTYDENEIDMDRVIKDNIILNLPMKQLCDKACKGLCPKCGANLNEGGCGCKADDDFNPGMEKLKDFFK